MDDPKANYIPDDAGAAPASTVIVRWWCEAPHADAEGGDRATRGVVRDLEGRTLGVFGGFEALVALLHRLIRDARRKRR